MNNDRINDLMQDMAENDDELEEADVYILL